MFSKHRILKFVYNTIQTKSEIEEESSVKVFAVYTVGSPTLTLIMYNYNDHFETMLKCKIAILVPYNIYLSI